MLKKKVTKDHLMQISSAEQKVNLQKCVDMLQVSS